MKYEKLRILSYDSDVEEEYDKRFNSYTTIKTNIRIHPFLKEERLLDETFELFYLPLPTLLKKEEEIRYNSEKLKRLNSHLPGVAQFNIVISNIADEIQSSNETEGIESSKTEISETILSREKKTRSSKRFRGIVNMYMSLLNEENYLSIKEPKDIRSIYNSLFDDEKDITEWPDGKLFRESSVSLKRKKDDSIAHIGDANEQEITNNLEKLVFFMNSKDYPYLEKCIISHYYLEYIHPFYDGNGRLGRYIMSSYLSRKLDLFTGVSISNSINKNREKYYASLLEVSNPRNKGEITHLLEDLLEIILEGQKASLEQLEEATAKMNVLDNYLKTIKNLSENEIDVLYGYLQDHVFASYQNLEDSEIANFQDYSRYKMNQYLAKLTELGYLIKVKQKPSIHKLSNFVLDKIDL
ncbi:Fic family protein [Carnobacterium maltaromaticum]|uniref:Fic family protein n=1 Tax=Carnobacterium maltaromaticum TaxID=2751 RepID=UPI000C755BB8|nr:Fic family protein [Carnobacterium maltaromaticum]PLS32700.1 Fic family protein [Carnobacterium maltaromaticum]PLS33200.1 Fic family protein [Carnobacterium maltaromaticum]PLS33286.1 Fic family protein [Carnobacterium maltaromaticum]PLS41006.1 Fic family protein [Carnobacterium maltaromaticum]PLS41766.1 Fic family protein [Carnobacterium maltaromaticum]